jgi:hypothetical protein
MYFIELESQPSIQDSIVVASPYIALASLSAQAVNVKERNHWQKIVKGLGSCPETEFEERERNRASLKDRILERDF